MPSEVALHEKGQASVQSQVWASAQLAATSTHCTKGPGLSLFVTQTVSAGHALQSVTSLHWPASMHGPQHESLMLGVCPAGHSGLADLHVTCA